jgi:hypothetical protein
MLERRDLFFMKDMKQRNILRISKDKQNPYVMINRRVMQDERLSWKARGLMGYLLSLPDDWTIYLEELERHSDRDGRESLASGIKELIALGYIVREQGRSEKGKFSAISYTVFESPQPVELPPPTASGKPDNGSETANGFPDNGKLDHGKPAATNTHGTNNYFTNNILTTSGKKNWKTEAKKEKYAKFYL